MPELEAVLFDMDGTLVDSEKVWDIGLRELARRYGGELSAPARTRMIGTSMAESMEILHADIAQPWRDPYTSVTWLEARVRDLFADGLVWRPGARELLAAVRAEGIPSALVTATRRHLVEVALGTIGADNFDVVVCGDDVAQTKPHPEPYLTAAARLAAPPARCVAIEDSPTGGTSARRAGCVVVAVPCEVALTDPTNVIMVDSLELLDVPTLRRFIAGRAAA
jgi:HAD superfamily hydrolase (TIGR01509 family)